MILEKAPRTRIAIALISIVCGAASLGALSGIITNRPFLTAFAQAYDNGGGTVYGAAVTGLYAAVVGSILSIVAGFIGLAGSFYKNTWIYLFFLVLSTVGALVCIVGGGMWQSVYSVFGASIYTHNTDEIQPPLAGAQAQFLDYTQAIFNQCCVMNGWASETGTVPCTGNTTLDCPVISNPIIAKIDPNLPVYLCECATSAASLAAFELAVNRSTLCLAAASALVDVTKLALPSPIPGNIPLVTATDENPATADYTFTTVPLVGWNFPPTYQGAPSTIPGAPGGEVLPYGCGLGYVKGLSWLIDVWHQQNTAVASSATLAIGAVQWFCLILGGVIGYLSSKESKDGFVDPYMLRLDQPASFYSPPGGPANQPVAAYIDNSSNKMAAELVVDSKEKDALAARLRAFYAKHDPGKDLGDVEDLAVWALLNGLPGLNEKLMKKYGADLNTATGAKIKVPQFDKLDI